MVADCLLRRRCRLANDHHHYRSRPILPLTVEKFYIIFLFVCINFELPRLEVIKKDGDSFFISWWAEVHYFFYTGLLWLIVFVAGDHPHHFSSFFAVCVVIIAWELFCAWRSFCIKPVYHLVLVHAYVGIKKTYLYLLFFLLWFYTITSLKCIV